MTTMDELCQYKQYRWSSSLKYLNDITTSVFAKNCCKISGKSMEIYWNAQFSKKIKFPLYFTDSD